MSPQHFVERQIHNLGGEGAGNEVQTTAMLVFLLQCGIKVIFLFVCQQCFHARKQEEFLQGTK